MRLLMSKLSPREPFRLAPAQSRCPVMELRRFVALRLRRRLVPRRPRLVALLELGGGADYPATRVVVVAVS